jgi:hypothetical protein
VLMLPRYESAEQARAKIVLAAELCLELDNR